MTGNKKILLIITALLLTSCSQVGEGKGLPPTPADTETPPKPTITAVVVQATETVLPSETTAPTVEISEPTQEPPTPLPTEEIILGDPFPLLPAGSEINLEEVEMITTDIGWGLSPGKDGTYHILRTDDGGYQWREITPPQPLTAQSSWLYPAVHFSDTDTGWASYTGTDLIWTTRNGGLSWRPSRLEQTALFGGMIRSFDMNRVWFFQFVDGGMNKVNTCVYRSEDGGNTWTKLLDPYSDTVIQSFDKTGAVFFNAQKGWLTRFFRGVSPLITLEITSDGGENWTSLDIPSPPSGTDLFSTCACGLYDPYDYGGEGGFRLTCQCGSYDDPLIKSFLYTTPQDTWDWEIEYIPEGDLQAISDGIFYVLGREIYRSEDGGVNWDLRKTVNWDGQFSFTDKQTALGIAYDSQDDVYALVKTTDGCSTFQIIEPELLPSLTFR